MMRFGKRGLNLAANAAVTAATKVGHLHYQNCVTIRFHSLMHVLHAERQRCHIAERLQVHFLGWLGAFFCTVCMFFLSMHGFPPDVIAFIPQCKDENGEHVLLAVMCSSYHWIQICSESKQDPLCVSNASQVTWRCSVFLLTCDFFFFSRKIDHRFKNLALGNRLFNSN